MVGERLAELRERRALTLHDLEELSGVGADGISKIENGHRKPRPSTLRKLARALDVEVEDFFREPAAPLAPAPPEQEYGALLKELGFSSKQIEAWRRQDELEKMSAKDLLEALKASPESLRLRKYYRENPPQATEPPRSESA